MEAFLAAAGCLLMLPIVLGVFFFAFRGRDTDRDGEVTELRRELDDLRRRSVDEVGRT